MFPDSIIVKDFEMQRDKLSYCIAFGLGPYLHDQLVSDILKSKSFFCLSVDETTNSAIDKQFDIHIRYFSSTTLVTTHYLDSHFFGHAEAIKLFSAITNTLSKNNFPSSKFLMLSSDGPNVNKSLRNLLNKWCEDNGCSQLIDMGSCTLHTVSNAFHAGLNALSWDIDEFAIDVFSWFKLSAARREDYKMVQAIVELDDNIFLRPVESRWLSLMPVCRRLVEQLPALKSYFLETIPNLIKDKKISESQVATNRYKRITKKLKDPMFEAKLHFIIAVSPIFNKFERFFQGTGPLVHLMYTELSNLTRLVLLQFLKADVVGHNQGSELLSIDIKNTENHSSTVQTGVQVETILQNCSPLQQLTFRKDVRTFYIAIASNLLKKLPFSKPILKTLQCIDPQVRTEEFGTVLVKQLGKEMKAVLPNPGDIDSLVNDWMMYSIETQVQETWYKTTSISGETEYLPVDQYWAQVFAIKNADGTERYPILSKTIKAALTLFHGSSDVERGFSYNKFLMGQNRTSLAHYSIKALRTIKDSIRLLGGRPENLPITRKFYRLINPACLSMSTYCKFICSK